MKVKVVEVFRDIYTDEIYSIGKILEVIKERADEMMPFVTKVGKAEADE